MENLVSYFDSAEVSTMLNDLSKLLLFKLEIESVSGQLSISELKELGQKLSDNYIVIFLATKDKTNFYLYWKSKEIQHFLMFKIYENSNYMNDLKLFEFIATFLADSLKQGYLGNFFKNSVSVLNNKLFYV